MFVHMLNESHREIWPRAWWDATVDSPPLLWRALSPNSSKVGCKPKMHKRVLFFLLPFLGADAHPQIWDNSLGYWQILLLWEVMVKRIKWHLRLLSRDEENYISKYSVRYQTKLCIYWQFFKIKFLKLYMCVCAHIILLNSATAVLLISIQMN